MKEVIVLNFSHSNNQDEEILNPGILEILYFI